MSKKQIEANGYVIQNEYGEFWTGGFREDAKWSEKANDCVRAETLFTSVRDSPRKLFVGERIIGVRVVPTIKLK